ncbi:MAG: hypothetical protein ABF630_10400 [Liquorilactobacillus sp.]|uniref:hypothetical protein n=1 Tax=Liquorilactobacillus nagelii TaxID=82688 RepID=UPI0039ECD096
METRKSSQINLTEELAAILQQLENWNDSLEDIRKILKSIRIKLDLFSEKNLLDDLTAEQELIIQQIITAYKQLLPKLKIRRMTVKRQILELTYARNSMYGYLNQQLSRHSLINLDL